MAPFVDPGPDNGRSLGLAALLVFGASDMLACEVIKFLAQAREFSFLRVTALPRFSLFVSDP